MSFERRSRALLLRSLRSCFSSLKTLLKPPFLQRTIFCFPACNCSAWVLFSFKFSVTLSVSSCLRKKILSLYDLNRTINLPDIHTELRNSIHTGIIELQSENGLLFSLDFSDLKLFIFNKYAPENVHLNSKLNCIISLLKVRLHVDTLLTIYDLIISFLLSCYSNIECLSLYIVSTAFNLLRLLAQ